MLVYMHLLRFVTPWFDVELKDKKNIYMVCRLIQKYIQGLVGKQFPILNVNLSEISCILPIVLWSIFTGH